MHAIARPCICTLAPRDHGSTSPSRLVILVNLPLPLPVRPLSISYLASHSELMYRQLSPSLHLRIILRQRPLSLESSLRLFQRPCLDATFICISIYSIVRQSLILHLPSFGRLVAMCKVLGKCQTHLVSGFHAYATAPSNRLP